MKRPTTDRAPTDSIHLDEKPWRGRATRLVALALTASAGASCALELDQAGPSCTGPACAADQSRALGTAQEPDPGPIDLSYDDGIFTWPVGQMVDVAGSDGSTERRLMSMAGYTVQQNFHNMNGPIVSPSVCGRAHSGIDITTAVDSSAAADDPVYAAGNGVVACVFDGDWRPGKAVVIEHTLPDGSTVYTLYGHLAVVHVAQDQSVRRGQEIGTIFNDGSNSHLHFETRALPFWDPENQVLTTTPGITSTKKGPWCPGRGYATDEGGMVLDPHYRDPVELMMTHLPTEPGGLVGQTNAAVDLRTRPDDDAPSVLPPLSTGGPAPQIPANTQVRVLAAVRDHAFVCGATNPVSDPECLACNITEYAARHCGDDCDDGACDWWYQVEYHDGQRAHRGFVKALAKNASMRHLLVATSNRAGQPWVDPEGEPIVHYTFDDGDITPQRCSGSDCVANHGDLDGFTGIATGGYTHTNLDPASPELGSYLGLDGRTARIDVAGSAGLDARAGIRFDLWVRRAPSLTNNVEDAIIGQWDNRVEGQQWLVTMRKIPTADGVILDELIFQARFDDLDGDRQPDLVTARHVSSLCPTPGWTRISGVYHLNDGLFLYQDRRLVARATVPAGARLIEAASPLRIGSKDGLGLALVSRFVGDIDDVRVWAATPASAIDSVLVIDSSRSMLWNDPMRQRRNAARVYLSTSSERDWVSVVDFDVTTRIAGALRPLLLPGVRGALFDFIGTIDASGGTNIGAGVRRACELLRVSESANATRTAILLTDGDGGYDDDDNDCFEQDGWSIHAFGFGDAVRSTLERVVRNTGGEAYLLTDAEAVLCEIQKVRARVAGLTPGPCVRRTIRPGEYISFTEHVDPGLARVSFFTAWPGSDVVMSLRTPSGRVIDRATVAPDVLHQAGPTYEVYTILAPEPGAWAVTLFGAIVDPAGEPVTFGSSGVPASAGVRNRPPDCSQVQPGASLLWPPAHGFADITVSGARDPDGDPVTLAIIDVRQDEAPAARGSGHTCPDAIATGTDLARVRAERSGNGDGRVYHLRVRGDDGRGGTCETTVTVCVPHDGGQGATCTDQGPIHDATTCTGE